MMKLLSVGLLFVVAAVTASPVDDPVIYKQSNGLRYQYREDGEGKIHLVDQWMKLSNIRQAARYTPDSQNVYHLFTRLNPTLSQPMLLGSNQLLGDSYFSSSKRTVFIVHGWTQSATSDINTVLVPAFLEAQDMNVFVVDWSVGSSIAAGAEGPTNAVLSGLSLAKVIDWIVTTTGTSVNNLHLVGFSLGAHQVAVAGRNVQSGTIPYITALDPGANMEDSGHIFGPDAGTYTEAIHTNGGVMGHLDPLAHSDFYPNGGAIQPGCGVNFLCNHSRSFYFFAESLTTPGAFSSTRCATQLAAILGTCVLSNGLNMGGLLPKSGILASGIFHLNTNEAPPFNIA